MNKINYFYFRTIFLILFLKIIIIILFPLTGDEAYFIKWGNNIDYGYYDHPPMVGWIIYLLSFINDSYIILRLFSFLSTILISFLIYKIAIKFHVTKNTAIFLSAIFLASPINILMILFTNDIPLMLFGTLAALFLINSINNKHWLFYSILSGVFFGLSFLSKYFAVFLMIGLVLFILTQYKTKVIKNILVISFIILFFIFENLLYNYNNCWNNIMFNFFSRTNNSYNINTIIGYFLLITYLFTPWGLYYLFKSKFQKNILLIKFLLYILTVVFIIFFVVSLKNKIGLHWFMLFLPFMYLLFAFISETNQEKLFKFNSIFTFIHITILLVLIFIPKDLFNNHKKYSDIILFTETSEICKQLNTIDENKIFASGYTSASILSYYCKKNIKSLFNNSKYGRLDDKLLDIRTLNNEDIFYFDNRNINTNDFKNVCKKTQLKIFTVESANFYLLKCFNFNYHAYKKEYLNIQKEKYYNIPKFLPINKCYFNERYY